MFPQIYSLRDKFKYEWTFANVSKKYVFSIKFQKWMFLSDRQPDCSQSKVTNMARIWQEANNWTDNVWIGEKSLENWKAINGDEGIRLALYGPVLPWVN